MIYRRRKKVDDVKKYIKTVNPDLPRQKIQKGYFKEAINEWRTAGYSGFDIQAWNIYARSKKVKASGFNMFTGLKINAEKEGKTWTKLKNCIIYDVNSEGFKVDIDVESDLSGVLYLGTSKFSMLKEFEGTFSVNKYTFVITGLSKQTKYYFYIKNTSTNEYGRSGIYKQKTGILVALDIDIGVNLEDIVDYGSANRTYIAKENPANRSGKIKLVTIYAVMGIEECKIATFTQVDTDIFTTRDTYYIGQIIGGDYRDFEVDLNVKEDDFIGLFYTSGGVGLKVTGEEGYWYRIADLIPCENHLFYFQANRGVSIYGIGTT